MCSRSAESEPDRDVNYTGQFTEHDVKFATAPRSRTLSLDRLGRLEDVVLIAGNGSTNHPICFTCCRNLSPGDGYTIRACTRSDRIRTLASVPSLHWR